MLNILGNALGLLIIFIVAIVAFAIWYVLETSFRLKQLACDQNWGRVKWMAMNLLSTLTMGLYPFIWGKSVKDVSFIDKSKCASAAA